MKDVKLKDGFVLQIDEDVLDDMELLDDLQDLIAGDRTARTKVFNKVFGTAKKDLYNHFRTESGRVPVSLVDEAFSEVIAQLNAKN